MLNILIFNYIKQIRSCRQIILETLFNGEKTGKIEQLPDIIA